ncbi:MAG: gp436 family protein [Caulobacteraceae bacterium]
MTYAVLADLVTRFGEREMIQLTDRSQPPADQIDAAVAQSALDAASSIVDGYVGAKYALPLPSVPAILVDVACDIARYRLYADQAPERVAVLHKEARTTLRDISRGAIKIDVAAVEPPSRSDNIETSGNPRLFSRCSLTVM